MTTKPVRVTTMITKATPMNIVYESTGTVSSLNNPILAAETTGKIQKILVREGQAVKKGQLLTSLNQSRSMILLNEAESKLRSAKAVLIEKRTEMQRYRILAKKGIVSQLQYNTTVASYKVAQSQRQVAEQALKYAQFQLSQTNVISPIDGYVEKVLVSVGEFVSAGDKLFQLINYDKLRAQLPFSEKKAATLAVGETVWLESIANPGKVLQSKVTDILPSIDPLNRAQNVVVDFDNQPGWKPGSSIHGKVYADKKIETIIVPDEAIVIEPNRTTVVFVVEKGAAVMKQVQILYSLDDKQVALEAGLTAGEEVVVHGAPYLANGTSVDVVNDAEPKASSAS